MKKYLILLASWMGTRFGADEQLNDGVDVVNWRDWERGRQNG